MSDPVPCPCATRQRLMCALRCVQGPAPLRVVDDDAYPYRPDVARRAGGRGAAYASDLYRPQRHKPTPETALHTLSGAHSHLRVASCARGRPWPAVRFGCILQVWGRWGVRRVRAEERGVSASRPHQPRSLHPLRVPHAHTERHIETALAPLGSRGPRRQHHNRRANACGRRRQALGQCRVPCDLLLDANRESALDRKLKLLSPESLGLWSLWD
eukprot:5727279-Prymnesium_polylepis.1